MMNRRHFLGTLIAAAGAVGLVRPRRKPEPEYSPGALIPFEMPDDFEGVVVARTGTLRVWTGDFDGRWSDDRNWEGGKPIPGDTISFGAAQ